VDLKVSTSSEGKNQTINGKKGNKKDDFSAGILLPIDTA
jgi:hypothetical protein